MRILVADDEVAMTSLLRRVLEREGHAVDVAGMGSEVLAKATAVDYDAILLDVVLPDQDGFSVCRELRKRERWAPVMFMTGYRGGVPDRVQGLDSGGDDFITKPFSLDEVQARLRALARRRSEPRPSELVVDDLVLDPATHRVTRDDIEIELTAREFALLELFMGRPGKVLNRGLILERVWGFDHFNTSNVVDVYVRYLRDKIDRPFRTISIDTVRGVGYRLRWSHHRPGRLVGAPRPA